MSKKNALIIGGSGQDGAFLAQEYLTRNFTVFSVSRSCNPRMEKLGIKQFKKDFSVEIDLEDLLRESDPEIIINLASASSVAFCEANPEVSKKINLDAVKGFAGLTEAYSQEKEKRIKFIQASSSEMFGESEQVCNEETQMRPITIYGKHKTEAHEFVLNRKANNVEYKSVILFNHESEFRSSSFVSHKATRAAAEVKSFGETRIQFGNIESMRDWGFAGDYMNALAMISLQSEKNCYVVASGEIHSIEEMIKSAFAYVDISDFRKYLSINQELYRNKETPAKVGNPARCKNEFNWEPSLDFKRLVERLVNYQVHSIQRNSND